MDGRLRDDGVVVAGDARQRFHDARGYGRPLGGQEVLLSRVEAAHLLFRGDLDVVDGMGFREFLVASATDAGPTTAAGSTPGTRGPTRIGHADGTGGSGFAARFLVYADLRDRGFYLSPVGAGRAAVRGENGETDADFEVYPRGKGQADGEVAYRVRVVGERTTVPATDLGAVVLAVVDEESEITYFQTDEPGLSGGSTGALPEGIEGSLVGDRVVAWGPPEALHDRHFYGQPLAGRSTDADALQLSLVEAAYLAAEDALALPAADGPAAVATVERGRTVEGDRFDRRLAVYRALRERGLVPKTGFKFGADFRVYGEFESVDAIGHSEWLVRVLPAEHGFSPRDLALDVRLAHGVRKRMVFALVGDDGIRWLEASRLTP